MNPVSPAVTAPQDIDTLLSPSYAVRVAQQFFTHCAHAPVTILILEWLLAGGAYLGEPDGYVLVLAALVQSFWLADARSRQVPWVVLGNLSGVLFYSVIESLLEGPEFFLRQQHLAYWSIAITFALLQGVRVARQEEAVWRFLENIARAAIPILLYAVYEASADHTPLAPAVFFADSAHVYLTVVVLLLGVLLAFADLTLQRTQRALRTLAERLHQLSSWGFGAQVVAAALEDARQVALRRQTRALLFMDIRGFTAWSEQQLPEAVVGMLNDYYAASEAVLQARHPIKIKFTADEVMAVFDDQAEAFRTACALQAAVTPVLDGHGLAAGLGLHAGPVVEGLLGSQSVKAYDVIGDAVNTASRLCSAAGPGELLVTAESMPKDMAADALPKRQIDAKGKREPLPVLVIAHPHAPPAR